MTKILKLQRMGCDFFKNDYQAWENSDCGNYRLRAEGIEGKYGITFGVDFGRGAKYQFSDGNGEKLKKPKKLTDYALHAQTWHYKTDDKGWEMCYHYRPFEEAVWNSDKKYTLADILKAVNEFAKEPYTSIEIV